MTRTLAISFAAAFALAAPQASAINKRVDQSGKVTYQESVGIGSVPFRRN